MQQQIKMPPLKTDLRMIESMLFVPFLVYAMIIVILVLPQLGFVELLSPVGIKKLMGLFCVPSISLWVIGLYKNIVSREMKEVILSLPYTDLQFGILRVCRIFFIYVGIFYSMLIVIILSSKEALLVDCIILPLIGMVFFTAISFVTILITKNELFTYVIIGAIGTYEYVTRGGVTGWFYPFQWVLKYPYYSKINIIILLLSSGILLMIGHILSTKREYLIL